ncbi:MAG: YciI family protein [Comamonas sp.]
MQFALVAQDFKDDGALQRRLACREAHLERIRVLAAQGGFISGGGVLDASGKMVGSNAHFSFADRAAFDAWLETEPYILQRVWEKIEISEVRLFNPAA